MPVSVKILLVTALLGFLIACDSVTTEDRISAAHAYLADNDPASALIELKNVLREEPNNAEARHLSGRIHLLLGDGGSAEKELRNAISMGASPGEIQPLVAQALYLRTDYDGLLELNPEEPWLTPEGRATIRGLRAMAHIAKEQYDQAREELDAGFAADPKSAEVLVGLGWLAAVQADFETARARAEEAFADEPENAEAWSLLANIERSENNLEAALEAYDRALELRPANVRDSLDRIAVNVALGNTRPAKRQVKLLRDAHIKSDRLDYLTGVLAYQDQDFERAQRFFEKAVQGDANDMRSLYFAGAAALQQGRYESATLYLSRFNARNQGFIPAMKLLAWLEVRIGNYSQAETLLRQVLAQQPEDVFSLNLLANALAGEDRAEESVEVLKDIVALNPDSVAARSRLGFGMVQLGQVGEGLDELQAAQALDPDRQDTAGAIVFSLLNENKLEEALAEAEKLAGDNPDSPYAAATLGTVHLRNNRLDEAEKSFRRTLELDPDNTTALSGLAGVAAQTGRAQEAKSNYRKILKNDPANLTAALNLSYLCALDGSIDEMIEVLERTIELNPNAMMPRLSLARYYDGQGDFGKVVELLEPVRAYSADSYEYLKMLSQAQYRSGNFRDARQNLRLMTQYAPRRADIGYMYAVTLRRTGDTEGAREEIDRVLELQPDHIGARHQDIELLIAAGELDAAQSQLAALQKMVAEDDTSVIKLQAILASASGDAEAAVNAFRRAYEMEETNYNLLRLETALWSSGDRDGAITLLTDWLRKVPNDQLSQFRLASRYAAQERQEDAVVLFTKMLQEQPDSPLVLNNLAWNLRDSDRKRAREYGERALELNPDSHAIKSTVAVIVAKDDSERALRLIREAQRGDQDSPVYRYRNAMILGEIGRKQEAIVVLRKLLREHPDFEQASQAKQLLIKLDR
ncbi:MAG: PEP-CTERM system TPR-repeat protein PrsT [Halioglobus sp.]